jgi:transcriptional regulator with XRE-family HTH domain
MNVNRFQQLIIKMRIIEFVTFKEWIWEKFYEWRGKTTRGVSEYAKYLEVKQPTVSAWMKGEYGPRGENLKKLAEKYPDVYDALGLPVPGNGDGQDVPGLGDWIKMYMEADKDTRKEMLADMRSRYGLGSEDIPRTR